MLANERWGGHFVRRSLSSGSPFSHNGLYCKANLSSFKSHFNFHSAQNTFMGELSLIKIFRAHAPKHPWIVTGPGHDCAILHWPSQRGQAFKIDQVVEGTHFVLSGPGAATPQQVGWKAMAKACSDIAATGFWPVAATVAVNLPKKSDERIALGLYRGICACCERYSFGLAGGDICVSNNALSVGVSLLGEGPKKGAWLRSGAQPGDALLVTGSLGASRAGKHLKFLPRLEEARAIRRLIPGGVHACIDITDGLSRDLKHLCDESRCGASIIEEQIPFSRAALSIAAKSKGRTALEQALGDGEDFELLLAVAPQAAERLMRKWVLPVALRQIGHIQSERMGCVFIGRDGKRRNMPDVGYEHVP